MASNIDQAPWQSHKIMQEHDLYMIDIENAVKTDVTFKVSFNGGILFYLQNCNQLGNILVNR